MQSKSEFPHDVSITRNDEDVFCWLLPLIKGEVGRGLKIYANQALQPPLNPLLHKEGKTIPLVIFEAVLPSRVLLGVCNGRTTE